MHALAPWARHAIRDEHAVHPPGPQHAERGAGVLGLEDLEAAAADLQLLTRELPRGGVGVGEEDAQGAGHGRLQSCLIWIGAPRGHRESGESPRATCHDARVRGLAQSMLRQRTVAAALLFALAGGLAWQAATELKRDTSLESWLAPDDPVRIRLDRFREIFGQAEVLVVMATGEVYTPEFMDRLAALHEAIEALEEGGPTSVESLVNARNVRAGGGAIVVEPLGDLLPDVQALRTAAARSQALTGHLIAADGKAAAIIARMGEGEQAVQNATFRAVRDLAAEHSRPGFELHLAGAPAVATSVNETMFSDGHRALGIGMGLIALLLALVFRHPIGVIGPLLVVVLSIVSTYGAMALAGYQVTGLQQLLPTILLAVGIGDAVHLLAAFRAQDAPPREAALEALLSTARPIIFTSLTTAIGMLGFTVTRLGVTSEFGAFAAVGVLFAMLYSLVLLPVILSTPLGRGLRGKRELGAFVDRLVDALVGGALRRPRTVVAAWLLFSLAAFACLPFLQVSHNPVRFLPEQHPTRLAFDATDARLGGTVNLEVLIEASPEGLKDPELLGQVARLQERLRVQPQVGGAASYVDLVREAWSALGGEGLPPTRAALAQTLLVLEMSAPEELQRLITSDASAARISLRVPWLEAHEYRPLAEQVSALGSEVAGAQVGATGGVYALLTVVDRLISDMLRSFGFAVFLIAAMLIVLLRSPRMGLISMVPNLLPIAITLAFMVLIGLPIDMFNLLVASIALGVVVDDTVHFFHHVAEGLHSGLEKEAAIREAAHHAGRAMVITSLTLGVGFGAFLSAEMANLSSFGALLVVTIAGALLAELSLGPALLMLIRVRPRA